MPWGPYVLAGQAFTNANFDGNAYADEGTGFAKALEKIVEHVANAWKSASTSSLTVGTGSKSLTVDTNKPFAVGQPVTIARTSAPATYMQGQVTAYTPGTGAMTVNVVTTSGSGGPFTDWTVSMGGIVQNVVAGSPLAIADGGTGATVAATALANLGGVAAASVLLKASNLSDLANVVTARSNLGLGSAALLTAGTAANNAVQLDGSARLPAVDGSQLTGLPGGPIPAGTKMLFLQAAAPTGWTQDVTHNDRVLRIVNTAGGGTGGSWTITGLTASATAITEAQLASHIHGLYFGTTLVGPPDMGETPIDAITDITGTFNGAYNAVATESNGADQTHTHTISAGSAWRPAYADAIVCTKNA